MAATSSNKEIVAPTMVGAGLGNVAKGLGISRGKQTASLTPQKQQISVNFDLC
jgi:hypothetical protein